MAIILDWGPSYGIGGEMNFLDYLMGYDSRL